MLKKLNMKVRLLLISSLLLSFIFSNKIKGQSVTILNGQNGTPNFNEDITQINYTKIMQGNQQSHYSLAYLNKSKGMLTLFMEVQANGLATWDQHRVAFYYKGQWHSIFEIWQGGTSEVSNFDHFVYNWKPGNVGGYSTGSGTGNETNNRVRVTQFTNGSTDNKNVDYYLFNNNNLEVYNGNYLPISNKYQYLNGIDGTTGYCNRYSLQTLPYSADSTSYYFPSAVNGQPANGLTSTYNIPVGNPSISTGVQAVSWFDINSNSTFGVDIGNWQDVGNLPGVGTWETGGNYGYVYLNIVNLPPDMLEDGNFRVHLYQNANTANDRIYEWVFNNQNFMTNPPTSLTATSNLCNKVTLKWTNSSNTMPNDGDGGQMKVRTAIFRDGNYLAMVDPGIETYDDVTAVQDVQYTYTVRHAAFSLSECTYWRSPVSANATGQLMHSPDQPITPSASIDKCNNTINLSWGFNGANPDKFKIDYSTASSTSGFSTLTNTITGSSRSFSHTGVTRGVTYYYRISAINTCSVTSVTYAECNGISPADPTKATNITATTNTVTNAISISWRDNANNETKYEIVRTDDQGNTVLTQINTNSTSYTDNSVANCRLYAYKVRVYNDCVLSGIISDSAASATLPPPNLGNTFDATHKLTASKGYFSNRVELSWSNNNSVNIDYFKIYRKQLGSALDSVQIATSNSGSALYIDNTADARVLYRYTIIGIKNCNGSELTTNISTDNGFRNPTGQISGHIEYNGGVAVKGVKVTVQNSANNLEGNSLNFSNNGTVTIPDNANLEPGTQMRLEFWIKPSAVNGSIINKDSAFDFRYTGTQWQGEIFIGASAKQVKAVTAAFPNNQWTHVSMVYDGSYLRLFANGVIQDSIAASGSIKDNSNNLVIGSATSAFKIDELRLTGASVSDITVLNENGRILFGNETAFKCNIHFDEAFGNYAYDVSQASNVFNANHGLMSASNVTWSSDIPTNSQLGYFGITDSLGNYSVSGIRYSGSGENFNLIPVYQTHSFTPNSRSLFIGDGSAVFGNQDFTDNSSFSFTGTLFYKGTTCPVPGAGLSIDGLPVISNGQAALTDVTGTFSISVPIGNHFVSINLFGHNMESGRYPATGVHDFQAPLSGVTFIDSTHRILLGRVVGGLIEANKAPGLGRSNNNIGKTYIKLVSPISGTPCHTETVVTNDASGEYRLRVTPLEYRIDSVFVVTNKNIINASTLTNSNQLIDMTNALILTNVVDTLKDTLGGVISIDSTKYNKRLDLIYRVSPTLDVKRTSDGYKFIGDDSVAISATQKISIKQTSAANPWGAFGWPVFQQNNKYSANIYAWEIYSNSDHATKDSVELDGDVIITNDMVNGSDPNSHLTMKKGLATYSFTCGGPNIASNSTFPQLSYAKELQINVVPSGAASETWLPNATTSYSTTTTNYYGYVIGQKITGTGVATLGPEKVDYILRDPPGSGSSATWVSGQSLSKQTELSVGVSAGTETAVKPTVGTKEQVGLGVSTEVEVEAEQNLGLNIEVSAGGSHSFGETVTSSYGVSTRDDAGNVGAPADIFIGRSRNWLVGPMASIELQSVAQCAVSGQCFGVAVGGYKLASMPGYAIAPADVKTRFSYTQDEIENTVIPTLQSIRNSILVANSSSYTSHLPSTDARYASNNDDPVWNLTGNDPTINDKVDTTGSSYTFIGRAHLYEDTVRTINNQIALWKQALARNEQEKIGCLNHASGYTLLDNFTLGSAVVTNSYEIDSQTETTESFELSLSHQTGTDLIAKFNGTGAQVETNITLKATTGGSHSSSTTNSDNFSYTLTDGDPGDIMSVDVYQTTTGNVFITRGGQTMCPYEDAVVCHYYNPSNPTAYISSHTYNSNGFSTIANATVQREDPHISITPAVQYNIPSNQAASYQLTLTNQSALTVNNDIDLRVYVAGISNPNGAILKIDGQNADATFTIPTGSSVIKTLTVERGPIQIDYDSLMIIFASACSDGIADTTYISVHFIPTCTDISFNAPTNNFIVNNINPDSVNIIISNYDYNYGVTANTSTVTSTVHPNFGFEKIGFEVKPSTSSTWLAVQEFSKTPVIPQLSIPNGQAYTQYMWGVPVTSFPDGNYELRAVSSCYNLDGSYAKIISPVLDGVMDRVNPSPFGTPSPGDGILDPNDDISIQFNEQIDGSSLSYAPGVNFDIRGVLNGTTLRNSESLNFDGSSNFVEVAGGVSIQKRSFTFEFWAKLNMLGINQTAISQGTDPIQNFSIGFDNNNKLAFTMGNQTALSTNPVVSDNNWHHFAVAYDYTNQTASLYTDGSLVGTNNSFIVDYIGGGKLYFGKAMPAANNFFAGNLHEVRLWSTVRSLGNIASTMNIVLNSNQSGLLYNWRIDEATGTVAEDYIRNRNADIYGATWEVNPNGNAAQFDGIDDNIQISTGTIAITKEMDFTLEFWFNSTQSSVATLFANGKGDGVGSDSLNAWNIQKDAAGTIHVYHKGLDFVATTTNYFDGNWHHFSLVMDRKANLSCYVDGTLENSVQALSFNNLSGSHMYLGARGYQSGPSVIYDNYFNGKMDEFRLWNTARKAEQIKRDKQNRMLGDEIGLQSFLPFEHYALVLGTPSLTPTFTDQSSNASADTVNAQNGVQLITTTPTIKLPRPIQEVNYTYSLNNDKIILTTTADPALLENVTLDVTVKNAYDMHGNKMQSPKTWIAYINKNQVKWQDPGYSFTKTVDSVITFTAPIVNSGGAQKAFTISGLPSWLTTNTTSGVIAPNSTQNIVFTIPAGTSIGDFSANISLTTDFGYAEILLVNLSVVGKVPTWTVTPANFQYSMNIFGQMKIDNVIATNPGNKIAAFSNGIICGVANLQYVPTYDRYEVFLNVYSNSITGDTIQFNLYDASSGLTFVNVTPSIVFVQNDVDGTVTNPITFAANTEIALQIPLNSGWTWASFPLQTTKMQNSNSLMQSVAATSGDVVLSSSGFDQYDASLGWLGNISQGGGYYNNQSYKINTVNADTLLHIGSRINPDSAIATINVVPGWNWIGFVSTKNTPLSTALGNYNATTGDLIKSQYEFAYYDNLNGWTGSLTNMKPTVGYMLKSSGTSSFSYPLSLFSGRYAQPTSGSNANVQSVFPFKPEQYRNTMSAIVNGNICTDALSQGNVAIGAFDANSTLRGYAYPTMINSKYVFYLTLYSNSNGESLNLKYFNTTNGMMLPSSSNVLFNTDNIIGTPASPIQANVIDSLSCIVVQSTTGISSASNQIINCSVYPNPFSDALTLTFNKEVNGKIELVDMLGKVIFTSAVTAKKEINLTPELSKLNVANGMYYLHLTGDINKQIKIIRTK